MPSTADLVAVLDRLLGPGSEEVVGSETARRLALALDPPDPAGLDGCDAVLVHRARGFTAPRAVGVVACHDPFDRALGLALNRPLHEHLGLTDTAPLADKATVHTAPPDVEGRIRAAFGGLEGERPAARPPHRVVLADAMTDALVRAAAQAGAGVFVTGSWRVPGAAAVAETEIGVLVVGHARQERWSLERLAVLLEGHGYAAHVCMR